MLLKDFVLKISVDKLILGIYLTCAIIFFLFFAYEDIYNATEQINSAKSLRLYADHPTYVNDYRNFKNSIFLFLAVRPNYLGPFFVIWLIGDNLFKVFIFNIICLLISVKIIRDIGYFNINKYMFLLLINPITFLSLFSINKEIFTLLSISFFISTFIKPRPLFAFLGLILSFLAKKELTIFMIILYANFYYFPRWNNHKLLLYTIYISIISIGSYYINKNFNAISEYTIETQTAVDNAGSAGTILMLNSIQSNYGYYLAVLPKTLLNLYGSVLTRTNQMIHFRDVYNDVVIWGQSFLFLYTVPKSIYLQSFKNNILSSKLFFSFIISCIFFSYIPVVQNRYFYSSYLLLIAIISIKEIKFSKRKGLKFIKFSLSK